MIQIDNVVVSFDVFREKFLCNLDACKGECCIEGDAGAPVELEEVAKLEEALPAIWDELSPEARRVIEEQGVVYTDQEGDLVTSIVNNKDCVFMYWDSLKYYKEFEEVQALEKSLSKLKDGYVFCRLGEESGDIEFRKRTKIPELMKEFQFIRDIRKKLNEELKEEEEEEFE